VAELGPIKLRSNGLTLGITCPDCSAFVPLVFELHLCAETGEVVDEHVTMHMKIQNMEEIRHQFEMHVRDNPRSHPTFATPVES
jgi:hypothetical protein